MKTERKELRLVHHVQYDYTCVMDGIGAEALTAGGEYVILSEAVTVDFPLLPPASQIAQELAILDAAEKKLDAATYQAREKIANRRASLLCIAAPVAGGEA